MILMYLRKSRADNPNESVAEVLARHERILQDYAEKYLFGIIKDEFIYKEVVSGETIESRTEIKKVINAIKSNDVEGVLVVEPQRLTRGDMIDCGTIIRAFKYSNTKIITPMHTYDLNDKYDEKFIEQELLRGNDYLEYTKEILMRGRMQSLKEGNYIGAVPPLGYDKIKIGKKWTLQANTDAVIVKRIFELRLQGYGLRKTVIMIQNEYGKELSQSIVRNCLHNPTYIGYNYFGKYRRTKQLADDGVSLEEHWKASKEYTLVKGNHQPIIDEDIFNQVQQTFAVQQHTTTKTTLQNKYAGIIKCGRCGKAMMYYRNNSKHHNYYYCRNAMCDNNTYYDADDVDSAIIDSIKANIEDFSVTVTNESPNLYTEQIASVNSLLAKNKAKQEALYDFLEDGTYTKETFKSRMQKLTDEADRLTEQLTELQKKSSNKANIKEKTLSLQNALIMIQNDEIDAQTCNNLLKTIVERIEVDDGNITMMMN